MPLPNLEKIVPIFDVVVPSTGDVVKFRPFLVKEEKLLLIALEGDDKTMDEAVSRVVAACAISPIKVESLPNFDLQYMFLQLRIKSVSEFSEIAYKCNQKIELSADEIDKRKAVNPMLARHVAKLAEGEAIFAPCETHVPFRIDLRTIKVQTNPAHSKTIYLTDTIGITMKYPNLSVAKMLNEHKVTNTESSLNDTLKTVAMCVESIFDDTQVYTGIQVKDMVEWLEKLTQAQFTKIQEFFETMPRLAHDINFECPRCGWKEVIRLEGLTSFFV